MRNILWITGDYFIDVDFLLVPYLQGNFKEEFDITWVVIKSRHNNIPISKDLDCKVITLKHRNMDPRVMWEYSCIFKQFKNTVDMVYSDYVGVPFYYPILLNIIKNKPIIHASHNVIPYPVWPKSLKLYVKYIFKANNHFHLFSKFTAKYFKEHYPEKSYFYCPMTLKGYGEVTTNNYKIDSSKLNLLFFGNVVLNKRLDLLIQAVKDLPQEIKSKVHLTVAGKCNTPKSYLEQAKGDKSISLFFKRIDDCEVAELFTKHDFLVLPYQDVAQSGPHMIAYYYNTPVIASNIDGFSERVVDGGNGFLFKRNNVDSLKEAITKAANLKEKGDEYKLMKENLKKYVDANYSLPVVSSRYVEYFKNIL